MLRCSQKCPISWMVRDSPFRDVNRSNNTRLRFHGIFDGCSSIKRRLSPAVVSEMGFSSFETVYSRYPAVVDKFSKEDSCSAESSIDGIGGSTHIFTLCASPVYSTHVLKRPLEKFNQTVLRKMLEYSSSHVITRVAGIAHCPYSQVIDSNSLMKIVAVALDHGAKEVILSDIAGVRDQQYYTIALRTLLAGGVSQDTLIWEANDKNGTAIQSIHNAVNCGISKISCLINLQAHARDKKFSANKEAGLPKGVCLPSAEQIYDYNLITSSGNPTMNIELVRKLQNGTHEVC